jgi:hypothetical protein
MLRFTLDNEIEGAFVLPTDPKGWDSGRFSLTRSPKYHGINYARTFALIFVCNAGKEYIDKIYEEQGIDATITVLIEDSCDCVPFIINGDYTEDYSDDYNNGGFTTDCLFEEFFTGQLDLKEYFKTKQETSVKIIEQSLNQTFLARSATKVDMFGTDTIDGGTFTNITTDSDITLHSKALVFNAEFNIINDSDGASLDPGGTDTIYFETPLFVESSEGYSAVNNPSLPFMHGTADTNTFEPIWLNITGKTQSVDIEVLCEGGISVSGNNNLASFIDRSVSVQIRVGATYDASVLYTVVAPVLHTFYNYFTFVALDGSLTDTLTVPNGYAIYCSIVIPNVTIDSADPKPWLLLTQFDTFNVKMKSLSTVADSQAKGTLIYESFARTLQSILNVEDPLRSTYYGRVNATPYAEPENGTGSFAMVMDGFRIRQYPTTGDNARTPKFSFDDIFDAFNPVDNIGVGFDYIDEGYKVIIEQKKYFYSQNSSISLENVPNIKLSVYRELYFNNIEVGFENWQTNGLNGLDEYCSKSQYTNGLKTIPDSLELQSKGIASAYLLEQLRRDKYSESATEDTDYDVNLFMIALNRSVDEDGVPDSLDIAEKDENFSNIENIIDPPSVYNLRWAVVRNFIRNISLVSPSLVKNVGRLIKFTSGEGNYKTITAESSNTSGDYNNQDLSGQQDIQWDSANVDETPLYIPELIEFEYPISLQEFKLLRSNPYDYIEVSGDLGNYKGYILDVAYTPRSGLTSFKLIRKWES